MLSKIDFSPTFALQLDETPDVFILLQIVVYRRYVAYETKD